MGEGGEVVPTNVIRAQVHPTVIEIPTTAFNGRTKLEEVDLPEGLLYIGAAAFFECGNLKHINIPSTVKWIGMRAFDGGNKGEGGKFTHLRIPPLVTEIYERAFSYSQRMFSLELPENTTQLGPFAFSNCHALRNLALPASAEVHTLSFFICPALRKLCTSRFEAPYTEEEGDILQVEINNALKHRFDKLPIHKMIYYQSYNNVTAGSLMNALSDSTGNQRDRLGMTPLHIMACSTVQNLELYKVLVDKYPEHLITEDVWGGLPILYAVWGSISKDILHFLIDSYQTHHPDYEFNWTCMVDSLVLGSQEEVVYNLLNIRQKFFPNQIVNWDDLLDKAVTLPSGANNYRQTSIESFRFILQCSIMERVGAIGLRQWRNEITNAIQVFHDQSDPRSKINLTQSMERSYFVPQIKTKLSQYEIEYAKVKESVVLLELALWKKRMSEYVLEQSEGSNLNQSMGRLGLDEEESERQKCRISCGSDIVIEHVLPYLVPIQR